MAARAEHLAQFAELGSQSIAGQVRHENAHQAFSPGGKIAPVQQAGALPAPRLTEREQAGEARPGGAIGGIEQQRAAIGEVGPCARDHPHARGLLPFPAAHHARDAAEVGEPQRLVPEQLCRGEQFLGRRGAAQE